MFESLSYDFRIYNEGVYYVPLQLREEFNTQTRNLHSFLIAQKSCPLVTVPWCIRELMFINPLNDFVDDLLQCVSNLQDAGSRGRCSMVCVGESWPEDILQAVPPTFEEAHAGKFCCLADEVRALTGWARLGRSHEWPIMSALARLENWVATLLEEYWAATDYLPLFPTLRKPEPFTLELPSFYPLFGMCSGDRIVKQASKADAVRSHADVRSHSATARTWGVWDRVELCLNVDHNASQDLQQRATSIFIWWLVLPVPIYGLLERISLDFEVQVNAPEDYLGMNPPVSMKASLWHASHYVEYGTTKPAQSYIASVMPFRDLESDSVRYLRLPSCWKFEFMEAVRQSVYANASHYPILIVDVGAGLGDCVLWAVAAFGASRVRAFAFEPVPWVAERLRWSVELSGFSDQIRVVECALGFESGDPEDVVLQGDVMNGMTNLYRDALSRGGAKGIQTKVRYRNMD